MSSNLYNDGAWYDALLGDQKDDIPFYIYRARQSQGPVLELACGTGRLTLPMAEAGAAITGLDLSPQMLAIARAKAEARHLDIDWVEADASRFDLKRTYSLILFPYNSMSHLHSPEAIQGMLACVKQHLAPRGHFILDVHNPNLALLNRRRDEIYPVEGLDPAPDGTVVVGEEINYDEPSQIYRIRWHYSQPADGAAARQDELNLRMFFPQELDALLRGAGFEIVEKFGDFEGGKFENGSHKQVVIAAIKGGS